MTIANYITAARLGFMPVFLACVLGYSPERAYLRQAAFFLYAAFALSDILDGQIARRFHLESRLGKRLDPLADKLLINLGFIFVAANGWFNPGMPLWAPPVFLARDVYIVLGAYLINERYGPFKVKPRLSGKTTTVLQMAVMISVLLSNPLTPFLLAASLAATGWSSIDYFYAGYAQVKERTKADAAR
ncbi:MAG TPA: CDP-alcohol phosphatidyltransferase family protein [Candidatus Hydrogenedentes bacterium]|nr:CDP-alcohol phosphatidyltransferase family protein [Candidatus Hydrogenedentota bacterium]